jgi:hypothetical protein
MNNELKWTWTKGAYYNLKEHPDICLEVLRKTKKKISSICARSQSRFEPDISQMQVKQVKKRHRLN